MRLLRPRETTSNHVCGTNECPSCKEFKNLDHHQCFIQNPTKLKEKMKKLKKTRLKRKSDGSRSIEERPHIFVYWDSETMQDTGVHIPNLVCAATSNTEELFNFEGETCIADFIDWLRELSLDCRLTVIAHNSQGFDAYLVLDELFKQYVGVDQIVNGAKIISLSFNGGDIELKDSLCFFQMPLASFPKAFGLKEKKKGFFPHFFNTPENQEYVGPLPDKKYYDPKGMSPNRAKEFNQWYENLSKDPNYQFNFQEELLSYCQSDVLLLKGGCEVFCREFEEISGFNPLERCLTIASACNLYYRKTHMLERSTASEPISGWHGQDKPHSKASIEWLTWLNTRPHHNIQHGRNGGEYVIKDGPHKYYVDGYDPITNVVYEFNGCYWHSCPKCYPNRDEQSEKMGERTMADVYENQEAKEQLLFLKGHSVQVIWECEWKKKKEEDKSIQEVVDSFQIIDRLKPRDAFFGGRTNAVKLFHKIKNGEKIWYVDFTSLYPWVNKNMIYPVGHPTIVLEPGVTDLSDYFGLAQCTVLPPTELYHPVLPHRSGGKLTFPLCRKCVETEQPKPLTERSYQCVHSDKERCLTRTWCTPELMEAVKQGYVIQHVHEVWHFSLTSDDMFTSYVNTFLKIKQEASGWPEWVGNDSQKSIEYVENYEKNEGIKLEIDKIQKNPRRRSLAKMMLNSFWGKYGQQGNKSQVVAITQPSRLYETIEDDKKIIQAFRIMNDEMVEIVYKNVDDEERIQPNTNIFIAYFTTCWARLKLHQDGLSKLNPQQVLYFDTDSIIYSQKEGQPTLTLGDYLGEFTNELSEDYHIVEFASAGPKNYGYVTKKSKVECKVRGFTLNTRGQEQLNYEILKQNVISEVTSPKRNESTGECVPRKIPIVNPHKIGRDPETKQLTTSEQIKNYRVVFDKRVVDPDTFFSYPYGFKKAVLDEDDIDMALLLSDFD